MGKTGTGRGRRRPINRQSVKAVTAADVTQKRAPRSTPSASSSSSSSESADVDADLPSSIALAEQLISRAQYGEAEQLLAPLVQSHPAVAGLHDLLALSYLGLQPASPDLALHHILTACQLDADGSGDRWMVLGQLRQGREAIEAFEQGAAVYKRQKTQLLQQQQQQQQGQQQQQQVNELAGSEEENADAEDGRANRLATLSQCLSTAYVSMAELYVTDCCDEEDAEQRCEYLLSEALAEWSDNADAAYSTANLRLIQGDEQQAAEWLDRTLAIIERAYDPSRQPALSLLASATACNPLSNAAVASYELRLNVAKLAYELERYEQCSRLVESLLDEDDHFIEVHHLAALAHMHCQHFSTATQHAHTAIQMCDANGKQDRRAQQQLRPVVKALRQLIAQCEGKEDVNSNMDDGEDEQEEEQAEEIEGEEDGNEEVEQTEEQMDDAVTEDRLEDQSKHDRRTYL